MICIYFILCCSHMFSCEAAACVCKIISLTINKTNSIDYFSFITKHCCVWFPFGSKVLVGKVFTD